MNKEYTPTWGIEAYDQDPTYDYYRDNNRVPTAKGSKVFESYHPCEFISAVNTFGGLGHVEQVIFTETPDKPLPQDLKNGLMQISDSFPVLIPGPGMNIGKEYQL